MNRQLASCAMCIAFVAVPAVAAEVEVDASCDIDSDYDLTIDERSVILTRQAGVPHAIVMRQGKLFVDDRWVGLNAADRQRIADFEQGARAAMPEAQAIGRDAADIAFTVLGEVAAGFASDPDLVKRKIDRARSQIDARLARSVTATRFNGRELGDGIGEAVAEVIPSMIGDIVSGAIGAAFSGDASRLKRLEDMDAQIDARVESRARALEARAQRLCERLVELDRIDDALEFRLAGGQPLGLLEARQPEAATPAADAAEEAARTDPPPGKTR
ncbi:DUF2884 family protein [Lysobacter arvi]|uniref:DUF2884 family protein n=1 Tax=Lysobacter arvi TaxID=3038776 RepID=A0ABU1CG43_9GAMM|nr:DUF2884 family protein [Lysobacter arvi]MDR0183908.1 DUF2884 family protein [Lysobacter arvi]